MDEEPHAESKKYYSLKLKVYLLVIISTLFLSFVAIILITLGVGSKNIYKYGICLFVMSFLLGGTVLVFIKKIQLGSGLIGSLFQSYVEKSDIIINEFEYPRKNIEKSFNRQFDLVNQSAAAIAQINQMILKTTEQINDCKEITRSAEKRLDEGASTMDKLKESIEVIKSAMEDMDKMLQVINQISLKSTVITDIVAKTELLAMNASIEAARAGEHGKGFSVVSEEVESLARTSGKSAKQIKDLLNESSIKVTQIIRTMNERIKEGEVVSKMACDAYERIKVGVSELKEQIQIIYEGTDMQKGVIKNVADALEKVTKVISQNNNILRLGDESIIQLSEINNRLFKYAEDTQQSIAGLEAAMELQKNRGNEVRRTLKGMGI